MDAQSIQGLIIIGLSLMLGFCLWRLWKAKQERPIYRAECQEMAMALQVKFANAIDAHKLLVSGLIEELKVRHNETQALRDKRDADRDRRLADLELVLTVKRRFDPYAP